MTGDDSEQLSTGEYGATRVHVSTDGSSTRLAFGRTTEYGAGTYYLAVHLSLEARQSLIEQLVALGRKDEQPGT